MTIENFSKIMGKSKKKIEKIYIKNIPRRAKNGIMAFCYEHKKRCQSTTLANIRY